LEQLRKYLPVCLFKSKKYGLNDHENKEKIFLRNICNLFIIKALCFLGPVFLETGPDWRYNTVNKRMASVMG